MGGTMLIIQTNLSLWNTKVRPARLPSVRTRGKVSSRTSITTRAQHSGAARLKQRFILRLAFIALALVIYVGK